MLKQSTVKLNKGANLLRIAPCSVFSLAGSNGSVYHVRPTRGKRMMLVNVLRSGNYTGNVPFEVLVKKPISIGKNITLPDPERMRERPIIVRFNPDLEGTPARIFTELQPAVIEVSRRFFSFPEQVRAFILYHEYGHLFYKTEWKTDTFALRIFLAQGLNPSQAFFALSNVLGRSKENMKRIMKLFNHLKDHGYVNATGNNK